MLRTHTCNELQKEHVGEKITLAGWVHRRRDHGGLIFIDLRDHYGITQITFDPAKNADAHKAAEVLRSEWVLIVKGVVRARPDDMVNDTLDTGTIEIEAMALTIENEAQTPPFDISAEDADDVNEALRLQYRYVDLRRPHLQQLLKKKAAFLQDMRGYFVQQGFTEITTPILASSSPEGARDFLVPSRMYPGSFYALPQAPQQFKQLLMVGGFDKYFQIAPCFRDEDPRRDRHYGEFYQLDMEMSFVEQEDVFAVMEPLFRELTEKYGHKEMLVSADESFPQMSWRDAMTTYGSDKPDLRFGCKITPVTELVKDCGFGVFTSAIEKGGVVHALHVEGGAAFSRSDIDGLTEVATQAGAKGLAYITLKEGSLHSPILKFLGDDIAQKIVAEVGAQDGDIIFFGADTWRTTCDALGSVRSVCGDKLNLKDPKKAAWVWIVDFPMYDYSEIEEGRIDFSHNPFSMPQGGMEALETQDPLDILGFQYDVVLNGLEISSGAIRNHKPEIMYKAFEIAGYSKEDVDAKFAHMIKAFSYGAPPHGGNAPGVDRLFMELTDSDSIRDIYAFPKDGSGKDLMLNSPAFIPQTQLDALHLKITKAK